MLHQTPVVVVNDNRIEGSEFLKNDNKGDTH